jgi:hypothetical protein
MEYIHAYMRESSKRAISDCINKGFQILILILILDFSLLFPLFFVFEISAIYSISYVFISSISLFISTLQTKQQRTTNN